jgi:hypothetical protein
MHWFAVGFRGFQLVSERISSEVLQLIALKAASFCFEGSHLTFKVTYLAQKRRALVLSRKGAIVGFNDLGLEFNKFRLKRARIAETYHRLRDVVSSLERAQGPSDSGHINHFVSSKP